MNVPPSAEKPLSSIASNLQDKIAEINNQFSRCLDRLSGIVGGPQNKKSEPTTTISNLPFDKVSNALDVIQSFVCDFEELVNRL